MKPLICEMCSSHDLVKQDGVFVCQHCGTKYSVEEARNMMFGGDSDPSGTTVRIDNSDRLEKLYQIARRAKADNNIANAGKYYDMILQEDPMSWEAAFYTTYYLAVQTNIAGILSAENTISNCLRSVMELLDKSALDTKSKKKAIREIIARIQSAASMFYRASMKHYWGIGERIRSRYASETFARVYAAAQMLFHVGDQIDAVFLGQRTLCSEATIAWEAGLKLLAEIRKLNYQVSKIQQTEELYVNKIAQHEDDENYELKQKNLRRQIEELNGVIGKTEKTHRNNKLAYAFSIIISFSFFFLDASAVGIVLLLLCGFGLAYEISREPAVKQKVDEATAKRTELEKQLSAISAKSKDRT